MSDSDGDWDTGADVAEGGQDKYNKSTFTSSEQPSTPELVKGTNTPHFKPSEISTSSSSSSSSKSKSKSRNSSRSPRTSKSPSSRHSTRKPSSSSKSAKSPPTAPKDVEVEAIAEEMSTIKVESTRRPSKGDPTKAFKEQLSPEALAFFNDASSQPFSQQAVQFLNAYWHEVGDQSEFIFSVAWETIKYADMHTKGIQYIHLYEEGNHLDFNVGLYFYEKLCKRALEDEAGAPYRENAQFAASMPSMMTAIVRKKELRDKVDVNFDGRVSFLEYLLYQYREFTNPAEFTQRAMKALDFAEHPEIVKARSALDAVNQAIREYEREKQRLLSDSKKSGVKGLTAKHQLSILDASPLAEKLNVALIKAEAAVRIVSRKFGAGGAASAEANAEAMRPIAGSVWWMNRDLEEKKKHYGKKSKK